MARQELQLIEREDNVLTMRKCFVCGRFIPEHTEQLFRGYMHYRNEMIDRMDDIKYHLWQKDARRRQVTFKQYLLEMALLICQQRGKCINCRQHFHRDN